MNPPPQAVRLNNDRAAARVKSEFRVSDRRFWGVKVNSSFKDSTSFHKPDVKLMMV